jgi:hypothetical protein
MAFKSSVSGCKDVISPFCPDGNLGITALIADGLTLSRDPEPGTDAKGRRAMNGQRNTGRMVQWHSVALIEIPVVIAMETGAQTNQPASDKKELL